MSLTVGKLKNNSLYTKKEISEIQPPEYDKLILYLSLQGYLLDNKNYLEDVGLDKFNSHSGVNAYWINMTQDGTFLGNPIYRVEKGSSDQGFFYRYNIAGLEKIQEAEEYILTGIFKSSNSNETIEAIDHPYQGGGNPWTQGNYVGPYESYDDRYYLGNGWWRYIYRFKIDRTQITNQSYKNNLYFGFQWYWQDTGQYVWGTQPQLYVGNSKKIYQGQKSSYLYNSLVIYKDQLSFEGPITNQISISNMNNYPIGYTGNVCGFSNNFESRFGQGNWSTKIVKQDNCIIPELRKAQRIITNQSGWGGWYASNIGNTSGDITYGVLIRLHYGEIQFGDLNTSNRLYINQNYYQQKGQKLGDWIWQCGTFLGSSGGRHLYQNGVTKADIQQVQIYNTNQQLSYVDGSKNQSYLSLPVDVFDQFKDEITVSFIYEPLSNQTYGTWPQIFTMNWWVSGNTSDWFGIYRGNGWSSQDSITFNVVDGTRQYSKGTSMTGINSRLNHKLFIQMSYSKSNKNLQIFVRDINTSEDLLKTNISLQTDFSFDKTFSYQKLGYLNQGSNQQNQKITNFSFYHKSFDQQNLYTLIPRVFQIDKNGFLKTKEIQEPHNLLTEYGSTQFETGQLGGIYQSYTQTNISVSVVPRKFKTKYSYFIKRAPNITATGSTSQNWGGLKLSFPDDKSWEENQTYRVSFWYAGYSQHNIEIYFAYAVGWVTMGVGLTKLSLPYITTQFTDEDGWKYYEQEFTIPTGYIYQTGTDNIVYYCMREFKIGYTYTTTDQYGTRLYINDLKIERISKNSEYKKTRGIKKYGVYIKEQIENNNFNDIYAVGTSYDSTYPENRTDGNRILKINETQIYNTTGRGLRLTIFDSNFTVISDTTYDVYGDDVQRTNLANQLIQIDKQKYWQLTSYDQVNTNATLNSQMQSLGSKIWPLSYRSPYQAVGKGQEIIKEDGQMNNVNYVSKQVINIKI